ncbi:hypothetical protein LZ30DRAFT_298910 [Colletotrichum cereale]|nr:hypothetical protein LZ30DRAFT_298910 [Colletotrichum cereale]
MILCYHSADILAVFSAATYLGSMNPEACPTFCPSFPVHVKSAGLPIRSEIANIPSNPSLSRHPPSPFRRIASPPPSTRRGAQQTPNPYQEATLAGDLTYICRICVLHWHLYFVLPPIRPLGPTASLAPPDFS